MRLMASPRTVKIWNLIDFLSSPSSGEDDIPPSERLRNIFGVAQGSAHGQLRNLHGDGAIPGEAHDGAAAAHEWQRHRMLVTSRAATPALSEADSSMGKSAMDHAHVHKRVSFEQSTASSIRPYSQMVSSCNSINTKTEHGKAQAQEESKRWLEGSAPLERSLPSEYAMLIQGGEDAGCWHEIVVKKVPDPFARDHR